jgi:hypothetical protein
VRANFSAIENCGFSDEEIEAFGGGQQLFRRSDEGEDE